MSNKKSKRAVLWAAVAGCIVVVVICLFATRKSVVDKVGDETPAQSQNPAPDSAQMRVEDDGLSVKELLDKSRLTQYENARFGFTFVYPSCFKPGQEPVNGDGLRFKMGHGIVLKAVGSYDSENETVSDWYEMCKDGPQQITDSRKEDKCFVLAGTQSKEDAECETGEDYGAAETVGYWRKTTLIKSPVDGLKVWVNIYLYYPSEYSEDVAGLIEELDKNN